MNRVYKVIYNRARNLYQVVSEIVHSRGKTKSLTAQHRHERLTTSILIALFAMGTSLPVGWAADTAGTTTTATDPTTVEDAKVDASNLSDKNKTAWRTALGGGEVAEDDAKLIAGQDIYKELRPIAATSETLTYVSADKSTADNLKNLDIQLGTNTTAISTLNTTIGTITSGTYTTDSTVAGNLGKLDTQVEKNAEQLKKNAEGLSDLSNTVSTNNTNLNTKITSIISDITSLKDLSNITDAGKKVITGLSTKITQGDRVTVTSTSDAATGQTTYTISANNDGKIASGDTNLVSGGTMYTELRPTSGKYISAGQSTAANLISLDQNLLNVVNALGLDADDTSKSYTSKLNKYFKVNPKITTTDTTTTYDPDAAANGTNSVAIGPSAQAGEKTTDATTSATTVTGGTSSTAIGDSAKANGDQSVALGYNSQVLNTTDQSGKTTATISGSTAIGSSAKVNGATDATAIGTSAQVNETATGGIAFGKNAVTGEDKGTVTVDDVTADVAAVGGENSVALGTSAKASGNTALALGNGAQVNNYTTQSGTTVTKTVNSGSTAIGNGAIVTGANNAVAFGTSATVTGTGTNSDDSMAIGTSASVATAADSIAFGTSAAVASGANNAVAIGNTAKANTSNTTAIGYKASATGAGAVAIGENTTTETEGGITIGSGTKVSGKSIVIGYATDYNGKAVNTESQNTDAIAIGNGAQANANDSVSIGHQAGKGTTEGRTSGYGSLIAIGTNAGNNVKGMQNVALGSGAGSNVKSSYNVAIGSNAGAGINYAAATDANPQNGYNVSIGYEANYQSADDNAKNIAESIAIGHSANAVSNATAVGYQATASGDKSMAFGYNATAADTDSIAIGDNASAGGGNIAIGHGSQAPSVTTYTSSYLTNNTTLNGYISLGGKTTATSNDRILRRITNVADGSDDQDAVTVAQLKQAYTNLEGTIKTTDTKISDTYTQKAIDSKIATVESKITASKTKYFSINTSSDTLTGNADSDGASTTGAADAMAIGPNASATSSKAVAIGNNASASGKGSIALGTADNPATSATVTEGGNTSANPHVTSAEGANSVAIGTSAIAQTDNSVALGTRASVYTSDVTDTATGTTTKVGQQSIAIGYQSETRNTDAISIGSNAKAYSNGSTAVGNGAFAQGADAIVLGTSSTANGASSGILGKSNTVNGSNTYAVGSENNVNGNWGAVTYSGFYGSKNIVNPVSDTSGNTKHGMDSLSVTGNSNTISQESYSDTVQNISILGNSNSVTGANTDEANAGTTANITIIGGDNKVTGRDGAGSDYMGKTWNQLIRTSIIGYGNKVNQAQSTISLANTQILGNDVTATLGNSVYLGTGAAAKTANLADATTLTDAEQAAVDALDTTGMTDTEKATAQANAKATARYATNLKAMKASGTTAGLQTLNTDTTYDDGTSYTYAGSNPAGVITVGSVGSERRIQNVAAGLVSATSTDAVNGSQLYALTRQIRFGGDNSTFGKTTAADDQNVVARGSNETISITGGSDAVTASTTDGTTTYTVDAAKLTGNNIAVVADKDANALHVQLASNLKDLNTAQLGSGNGESYKETIKLDGTGTSGGQMTLASADGTVKTTLDTTGITIANGPKFTSSGIDAANQQIHNVTAGTKDADAVNVKQLQSARTLLTQGTNTTLADTDADGHHTYTVNVDNLAVKANGTGTTTVELAKGINFKDGTNTTAAVGADGTVTISATHNKLSTVSAAPTGTNDDVTLTLTDTDGNTVTSTGLKNTYTTVTKDSTAHTVTFARNDGTTQTLSLGDLDGASTETLNKAAAKATSEVTNGTNVASVTTSTGNNGQNIYTVNVDDLAVKTTSGEKKSVHLADGLVFADGTNTTATVGDNGTIKFNVSNDAIKKQAVQAVNVTGGSNVTVTSEMNTDGTLKTFTVAAPDLKYSANGTSKTTSLANGISFAAGANTTAEIDNNGAIKINATHNKLNATGTATKATADNNSVTLTLNDQDGNTTTTALTDTYTTVSKDATSKKVTFKRNDGETQTLDLNDLGGITEAQDKYVKSGTVTYNDKGEGTASLTGNNGLTASITGLKDTKISSGTTTYVGTQGNASGSATLTMNDGSTATITGLQNDYITSAAVGTETNHVTMTRLGGGTVDLNMNPILEKYSLSDYHLVGAGTTHDQAYAVDSNGTVTLNVVDDKNPTGTPKTIQITGLASQSGVNAGRTTVKSSDSSVIVDDGTSNSDTHTYDIKVDYSKIPANLTVKYSGDNGTSGSNTMDKTTAFSGTANQIVTKAEAGKVTFKLADDISGIQSVTTGEAKLDTNGLTVTDGPSVLKTGINAGGKTVSNVGDAAQDTDAATLGQVKKARTKVAAGSNVAGVDSLEDTATHQTTYTVNVNNLSVKANNEAAKSVTLKNGLTFNNGTNTTASVGDNGEVKYDLNSTLTGLISVTAGNSTLDNNGLTIKEGSAAKVAITSGNVTMGGNVIHNVGDGVAPTDAVNKGQLEALQTQVSGGWNLSGNNAEGTAVTAQIGAGKTVTYGNGNYTKAVVTKDDTTGNATVKVDVTTGAFGSGTDDKAGTVTATVNGLATTQDVANAINSAYWTIQDGNNPGNAQQVKAGDTVSLKAGDNLSLDQNGREFTYKLNKTLQNMTSVTAVDDKQNTAVLNSEGLKVSDKDGNSLTQHATEIRLHDATKAATDTTTDVVLNKQGLQNGGHTITGVAKGTVDADSQDAINGSQLYELQQKVTNGWKITGDDTTKASNIGNDKTVSFVNGDNSYIKAKVDTTNTGATVSYTAQTASLTTTDGKAALTGTTDGLVTGMNLTSVLNSLSWTAQSSQVGTGQNNGSTAQSITAGSKVSFIAGDNMILTQDGTNFTYALNSSLTDMNTIAFTGLGNGASNLTIGLQNGGGANPDKGYYITGLSNTKWDQSNYEGTRAATEAQLREAIDKVSAATGTGGFGLTADDGANNGGEKKVTQTLGRTIAIQGDGTYGADGTVVKQGNISTVAYTDNAGPTGAIKVKLNNDIDLSEAGSLTIGASKVSAGSIVLDNTGDAAKKIALNSTAGTASIGGVTVNGTAKTIMGLANTTWDGTAVSGRAATEDQLAKAISDASTQASNSELHIRKGTYGVGKDKDGQDLADPKGKNSVSIDVVNAKGAVDGQVVINDVAKASELGTVGELADNLKNPNGGPTTVVQAVNKVNQKVDDSLKQVNGDVTNAVTEAKKHTEVQSVDSDNNVTIDGKTTNAAGGKVYKLGLNKQHMNLDKVHIYGTEGKVTAKDVEAETVKTGNTTVADGRVVVGGDNGIKIEANDGQQTISGLSNRTWNGRAVSGRAATEDQLQQAVENATATAAQNEQHIQAGNYNVGQGKGLDGKAIDKNSVAINVVSGDGTKPGDVKGQVVINNVAKADELGDVAKLNDTVKNADGRPTSTVDAINNLDKRVETKVGDNVYSNVAGKEIADGDSATTAIGKLNNRMNDIYTTAGQHSSVSTADTNLTLSESKNASGGTDYKIGLNKEQINLGNLTIKGNEGSIEAKSIKSDSFTAGDTVVNKDGIKVGDKSALTGDSLKVNGKTYVDDKGVNANGQVIRNVGDGKNDGDAVNVKQVNELAARQGEAINQNAAHINQLDRAVNRLDSRINRVGAGAAALAALHPGNYDPDDKVDFAAGFGNYRGASAAAVGMYYHPDETTTMSVGASFGGGENMVNAGITWKMGKNSGHMRTQAATKAVPVQFVAAPTQTTQSTGQTEGTKTPQPVTAVTTTASGQQVPIVAAYLPSVDNSTRAENDELKELLARQTAILEKLAEQKTAAAPAAAAAPVSGEDLFPDVPENHWAYDFVAKLAKAGALKDCRVEAPANNPMLTRNDFAQILYTALKNGATKNPALNKDNGLNRLASEFRVELKNVRR